MPRLSAPGIDDMVPELPANERPGRALEAATSPLHDPVLRHALLEAGFDVEATATNRSALESVESHGLRVALKPIIVILRARRTG